MGFNNHTLEWLNYVADIQNSYRRVVCASPKHPERFCRRIHTYTYVVRIPVYVFIVYILILV